MKKIILVFAGLLFIQFGFSQDTVNHFYIENGTIVWKCTFKSDFNEKQLLQKIENNNLLENLEKDSIKIEGKIKESDIDYKGAGYRAGITPIIFIYNYITGIAAIRFEKGYYIVRIINITFVRKENGRFDFQKKGVTTSMDYVFMRKGHFIRSFKIIPGKI